MSGGSFMVSRGIWDHPDFAPSEFSEREAFLWLVSEAAWKPRRVRAGKSVVDLERGQLCASVRFMATAWKWSKSRVDRFLKRVQSVKMIRTESGTGQLVITICNYDKFQGQRDSSGTVAGQQRDSSGTNENKGNKGNKGKEQDEPALGFSDFWEKWPLRKANKKGAVAAFNRLSAQNKQQAIDRMTVWASEWRRANPTANDIHPATYLNGQRWTDEFASRQTSDPNRFSQLERWKKASNG